jgi:hypothetical protein
MGWKAKYNDGRWQKLARKAKERDNYTCQDCGDDEEAAGAKKASLQTHHIFYEYGREPWEADLDSLVTLCRHCHDRVTEVKRENDSRLKAAIYRAGFSSEDIGNIARGFEGFKCLANPALIATALEGALKENALHEWILEYSDKQLAAK